MKRAHLAEYEISIGRPTGAPLGKTVVSQGLDTKRRYATGRNGRGNHVGVIGGDAEVHEQGMVLKSR